MYVQATALKLEDKANTGGLLFWAEAATALQQRATSDQSRDAVCGAGFSFHDSSQGRVEMGTAYRNSLPAALDQRRAGRPRYWIFLNVFSRREAIAYLADK